MSVLRWIVVVVSGCTASMACAGGILFGESRTAPLFGGREAAPIIQAALAGVEVQNGQGSLFAGAARGGLLAPYPARQRAQAVARALPRLPSLGPLTSGVRGLKALIAKAEAGAAGYDAVVWSARVKPPKRPTDMTLAEIYTWIKDTPGQNHAIGRYQFIPKTLRWLVQRAGLSPQTRFAPEVQDHLAHLLLQDAGLDAFLRGEMSQTAFMNNLAKTWAGLPTSSGKSHYHGLAGNKATMSWATFDAHMRRIFPRG